MVDLYVLISRLSSNSDAMTGAVTKIDIVGRDGVTLTESWQDGPKNFLGLFVKGYPNMFQVNGPGSPSVLTNMINGIEQHAEWISDCIIKLDKMGVKAIDAKEDEQEKWVEEVNHWGTTTIFAGCNSWYLGANIPGKKRQMLPYLGGFSSYIERCNAVLANDFAEMSLTK